jgi:hypothetical protein
MRYALFWDITQRRVVILYRRFGTSYRSRLQGSKSQRKKDFFTLENGTDTLSPKHSTLCNTPEERRCHQHRGGSLKSRKRITFC